MLVVHPSTPVKTVQELIGLAASKPGQLMYASGGNGTSNHLAGKLFNHLTKVWAAVIKAAGITAD